MDGAIANARADASKSAKIESMADNPMVVEHP
jgi:hypothetical protein